MYLRNYGLRKTWLDKCLKSPVSENPCQTTWEMGQNIDSISVTSPLPYSLITVKVIEWQRSSLSEMQNLKPVC